MIQVILEYRRDAGAMTSTGQISTGDVDGTRIVAFNSLEFREMLKVLCRVLSYAPAEEEVEVHLQRTDRDGLLPYKLDAVTVTLLRTDPVAGIQALEYPSPSPSTTVQRVREERSPSPPPLVTAGRAVLADAFGDVIYFKVRGPELECPGCGFWGRYTLPEVLSDPDRVGAEYKTIFACSRKCRRRFHVSCAKEWGYVDVDYLLKNTDLQAFYFPRGWNQGHLWVSREALQKKFEEFTAEKAGFHVR